jgi:Gas vesicle protein G
MNLLTLLFRLPLMPLQGLIQLAELLRDQAEQELHDPAAVRHQLEELERSVQAGELSAEDIAAAERSAVGRVVDSAPPG